MSSNWEEKWFKTSQRSVYKHGLHICYAEFAPKTSKQKVMHHKYDRVRLVPQFNIDNLFVGVESLPWQHYPARF